MEGNIRKLRRFNNHEIRKILAFNKIVTSVVIGRPRTPILKPLSHRITRGSINGNLTMVTQTKDIDDRKDEIIPFVLKGLETIIVIQFYAILDTSSSL
jgi:hypothetical protein